MALPGSQLISGSGPGALSVMFLGDELFSVGGGGFT